MKIRGFEIGVESFSRVTPGEEMRLPPPEAPARPFLPQPSQLDAVLRRPSLDERLTDLLQPRGLDPALLVPAILAETRLGAGEALAGAARRALGRRRQTLERAARILEQDAALDREVRAALAALFRV